MKRALVLGLVVLALTGCGAHARRFGDLRVTADGRMTLQRSPPPHLAGPRAHLTDAAFASARTGFVSTSAGGAVQRTSDGGATWRDVVRGPRGSEYEWLATAPGGGVYAGGSTARGRPLLSVSGDGGDTWHTFRPRLRSIPGDSWRYLRTTFVTRDFGYTVPDPGGYGMGAFAVTRDGGKSWQPVNVPTGSEGADFLDERHGFAAGSVPHSCAGAAWRTIDGGATWTRIFCAAVPLAAVQFVDRRHGFLAGGWAAVTEEAPSGVVYATSDGGATWQRRYVNPRRGYGGGIYPIASLHFVDARRGWARTGQCKEGASGPCAGEILVTRDGGRSWAYRGVGVRLSPLDANAAWMLPRCELDCTAIWRTGDAGRRWTPVANPTNANVYGVQTNRGLVSLETDIARFVGGPGRRWRVGRNAIVGAAPGFSVGPAAAPEGTFTAAVADRRTAFALVEPPGLELERCGLGATMRVLVTRNHGRTWRRTGSFRAYSVAADGRRVYAVAQEQDCRNQLAASDDAGRSWTLRALPRRNCAVSAWRKDVWLRCGRIVLVSRDAGAAWLRLRGPKRFEQADLAADAGGAWLALGGHLWRTTDRGRTWQERWPRLPTP